MKMTALYKAAMASKGKLQIDSSGKVTTGTIIEDGVEYATYKDAAGVNQKLEIPKEPELPSHLRHWARNNMSLPEYELAASISPEMFKNPTLVQVIRWPTIFRDLRYNENLSYGVRNGMTYLKDWPLEAVLDEENAKYIEANTLGERREAMIKAAAAADAVETKLLADKMAKKEKATDEEIQAARDSEYRKVYAQFTQSDTIREYIANNWLQSRAVNEIPRGRFRNSHIYHRLVNAAMGQQWKEKDSEDVTMIDSDKAKGEKAGGLLTHALQDLQAERRGEGVVYDENRKFLNYMFCDPRSSVISRPIGSWPTDLQNLYAELEAEGKKQVGDKGQLSFPSDKARGIKPKTKAPKTGAKGKKTP